MTAHPLADLAAALNKHADTLAVYGIDAAEKGYHDRANELGELHRHIRTAAKVATALHPDVARCALALADGLRVPEGWSVEMSRLGDIAVRRADGVSCAVVARPSDRWAIGTRVGTAHFLRAQHAVDAAVRTLGGTP